VFLAIDPAQSPQYSRTVGFFIPRTPVRIAQFIFLLYFSSMPVNSANYLDNSHCSIGQIEDNLAVFELYEISRPSIDGKIYYGQHRIGANKPKCYQGIYMGSGIHLRNSIKKYGIDKHVKRVLFLAYSKEEANEIEEMLIAQGRARGELLMNIAKGGDGGLTRGVGWHHSEEIRQKISEAQKGKIISEESIKRMSESHRGKSPWNKGLSGVYKASQETREKLSAIRKGRKISAEQIEKLRIANKGKKPSPETIEKMRETKRKNKKPPWNKGIVGISPETRERLSKSHMGKKQSPETIAKRIAKTTGQKRTQETKRRISEKKRQRDALRRINNAS
jgi:hypothetical protein